MQLKSVVFPTGFSTEFRGFSAGFVRRKGGQALSSSAYALLKSFILSVPYMFIFFLYRKCKTHIQCQIKYQSGHIIETKNNGNGNSSQYIPITVCVSKENLAMPSITTGITMSKKNNTRQKSIASVSCLSTRISTMNGNMVIKIFLSPDLTSIS